MKLPSYSLRALLAIFTVACLILWLFALPIYQMHALTQQQLELGRRLEMLGGKVSYGARDGGWVPVVTSLLFGDRVQLYVAVVIFKDCNVTSSDLQVLSDASDLTGLVIVGSRVDDAIIQILIGLERLEAIGLRNTSISPEGLLTLKSQRPDVVVHCDGRQIKLSPVKSK